MEVAIVNPLEEPHWDRWVESFPAASYFHTTPWARVLWDSYRYGLHYGISREGSKVTGQLPVMEVASLLTGKRGVCLPFADECPALCDSDNASRELIEALVEFGRRRGWEYLEIRGDISRFPGAVPTREYALHDLDLLANPDDQFRALKKTCQRNILKAQKEGVEVVRLQSWEAMEAFYELHCDTRKRHGSPPQPIKFFRNIHEHIVSKGQGNVMLARTAGHWIAGAIYFHFARHALYKFGASDLAFQHLRPNNLVMWEAIRYYGAIGLSYFSFGRTDTGNTGLLQFKRSWGTSERAIRYYRIGIRKSVKAKKFDAIDKPGLMQAVFSHLPKPVLRWIGVLLYRHIG